MAIQAVSHIQAHTPPPKHETKAVAHTAPPPKAEHPAPTNNHKIDVKA
jgi:hypothetical protein